MNSADVAVAFAAGTVLATLTAPVGVSGAVFLLPVQLDVLGVPSPQVTPTNLLYNVLAAPGALLRYRRQGQLGGDLAGRLLAGTLPGVVVGAVARVVLVPDLRAFRLLAAAVLGPLGIWLLVRAGARPGPRRDRPPSPFTPSTLTAIALATGVVGGLYGIGGGSILSPVLVAAGYGVVRVAPAALAATWVTSVVGIAVYLVLAAAGVGDAESPDWSVGLAAGAGGLVGGTIGARLQPKLPERLLRAGLGGLAVALAVAYVVLAWRA